MFDQLPREYVLGIDLGSNSIGWAIIGLIDGEPAQLVRAGARVFEAGMDGDLSSGREESRNLKRREARGHRRLLWRRRRRLTKLFNLLRHSGLLPAAPGGPSAAPPDHRRSLTSDQLQDYFNNLDKDILSSPWFQAKANSGDYSEPSHTMPYILRATALDEPLQPFYIGRAIYHLAQRRGFLSNRKQATKKNEDEGVVKKEIGELRGKMVESGSRTLGEYFARLSPAAGHEEQHIRRWHTHREMLKDEFEKIWEVQSAHHPDLLTPERKKQIYHAIFFQRPLWFDPSTIGKCELEPDKQRAPAYLLISQRFRLLQKVNDLQIEKPGGVPRYLTPQERALLSDALELHGDMKFDRARKTKEQDAPTVRELLGLPKGTTFNLQLGGEEKMPGNRTNSQFCQVFGNDRWLEMSAEEHDQAIQDILSIRKPTTLRRRALEDWKLDEPAASSFCNISLEPEYMNYSRKAIDNLLPLLEQGTPLQTARKQIYPESFRSGEALPMLPPLEFASEPARFAKSYRRWVTKRPEVLPSVGLPPAIGQIRNPAVMRSLTELRKVVNAVIRQYGKPTYIHVEMARELKQPRSVRERLSKRNRENEAARKRAVERIEKMNGDPYPSRDDVRRIQLFDECHGACVYCGQPIAARNFLGKESQVDIDHIIPFSRSMDDSFSNLVICHSRCNREKGNRTPFEALSGDEEHYEHVKDRAAKFAGDREMVNAKAKRFQMDGEKLEEFLSDFRKRQLNDTAYASRVAADYLGLLYGGRIDQQHNLRVQATAGRSTSRLRSRWKLNSILDDGPTMGGGRVEKERTDHRHHAIDAVVIALTDAGMMERLADAAKRGLSIGRRFDRLDEPWLNFVDSVRAEIAKIVVSHRVSRKVSGALHEETIYSRPMGEKSEVRVRKPLASLTKQEVEKIADEGVRKLIENKLKELGGVEPKKAFASAENLPRFPSSGVVIRSVRITKPERPTAIGEGRTKRHVVSGNNHHVEIYAEMDHNAKEKQWGGEVVPISEAYQRLKAGRPIVKRDFGPLANFKFSLAPGEVIECDDKKAGRKLWAVRGATSENGSPRLFLVPVNDAREKSQIVKSGLYWRPFLNPLRKLNARKMTVSPTGEVTEAHD